MSPPESQKSIFFNLWSFSLFSLVASTKFVSCSCGYSCFETVVCSTRLRSVISKWFSNTLGPPLVLGQRSKDCFKWCVCAHSDSSTGLSLRSTCSVTICTHPHESLVGLTDELPSFGPDLAGGNVGGSIAMEIEAWGEAFFVMHISSKVVAQFWTGGCRTGKEVVVMTTPDKQHSIVPMETVVNTLSLNID